jgi:hypothetical protein
MVSLRFEIGVAKDYDLGCYVRYLGQFGNSDSVTMITVDIPGIYRKLDGA